MFWLLAAVWIGYSTRCVPTYLFTYSGLRQTRGRVKSWGMASGLAIIWPVWLYQFRRWQKRQTWTSEIEEYLKVH